MFFFVQVSNDGALKVEDNQRGNQAKANGKFLNIDIFHNENHLVCRLWQVFGVGIFDETDCIRKLPKRAALIISIVLSAIVL